MAIALASSIRLGDPGARDSFAEPAIGIYGLTKRFTQRASVADLLRGRVRAPSTAVDRVFLEVPSGEAFGILGPNGAGKTTLFKMLSTVLLPDAGTARVRGQDIIRDPMGVKQSLAGVSSDERSLNWRLSARENLLLFAALHGISRGRAREDVDAALARVGLSATGAKMVAGFSSGMRQRLLIARALLSRPSVLLLDEPTRALDPISAKEFRTFLREELIGRQRCTIVLATHNADEALGFCDRLTVLHRGRVLATGTPSALCSRFGEERYRLLLKGPTERLETLLDRGLIGRLNAESNATLDWRPVECTIAGGPSQTADVLRVLLECGVEVARLERVELSLADLIGRIIQLSATGSADA